MALIKCEECGKEYSDKATSCPDCACPNEKISTTKFQKNNLKCDVEINGNEVEIYYDENKLKPQDHILTKIALWILFILLILVFIIGKKITSEEFWGIIITYLASAASVKFAQWLTPWYRKEKQRVQNLKDRIEKIKLFFEKKIPIYNDMKPEFKSIEVLNESGNNKDQLMFNIYMKAYKLDADAIVLNSDTVLTHVKGSVSSGLGGRVSGSTSSSNTHKIMATLIKYRD